jgi:hypothetical protein
MTVSTRDECAPVRSAASAERRSAHHHPLAVAGPVPGYDRERAREGFPTARNSGWGRRTREQIRPPRLGRQRVGPGRRPPARWTLPASGHRPRTASEASTARLRELTEQFGARGDVRMGEPLRRACSARRPRGPEVSRSRLRSVPTPTDESSLGSRRSVPRSHHGRAAVGHGR